MLHFTRSKHKPHPVAAFLFIVVLAFTFAASILWLDEVATSADALNVKDASTLLPK
jgi:hypothetical protein